MNILILWAVFSGPALAQTPAVREFDAPSYVRAVLEASPELRQAEAGLEAAAAQAKEKFAALVLPTFGFTAESTPYGHAPSNSNLLTHWRLTRDETTSTTRLNLNLFNSFQDFRSARSARLNRDSSGAALSTAQGDRAFEAVRVFFDLGLKNRLLEVAAENLKAQEEQYRMTEDLYKNGMKSLSDLLKSETDWRSGELRLAAAQAAGKTALIRFNALIDRAPLEAAVLKVDLAGGATDLPRLEEDAVRARTARPELRKALLDLEIAEVSVRTARQALLPTFSVDAVWSRSDGGPRGSISEPNPNYRLGLALSMPVGYNVASQAYSFAAARAVRRRQAGAVDQLARQVQVEVHEAFVQLEQVLKQYSISTAKEAIADRNLGLVTEQYRTGSADVLLMGQARLDVLNARVERAQALHEAFINRARYRLAVGDSIW